MEDLVVALVAGLLGGSAVAVIGGLITLIVQGREHTARGKESEATQKHERAMARDQRLQDRRASAYRQILEFAYHLAAWVERTEPVIGPAPPLPEPIPDNELVKLNALTVAYASKEVRDASIALSRKAREFNVRADHLKWQREDGEKVMDAWGQVEEARKEFRQLIEVLGNVVSDELSG